MTQHPIFKGILADRLAAIGSDVDAAGGEKVVGSKLRPKLSPETARRWMANALNPKQNHELTDDDVMKIKQWAREAVGRSRTVEFEAAMLRFDLHWITPEEQQERSEKRLVALLDQVQAELASMKAAREGRR